MRLSKDEPGFIASIGAHAAIVVVGVAAFSSAPKFADQQESIAVEVLTAEQFSAMTQGERTAKTVQEKPAPRVDKVAEIEEQKPDPGQGKRDVPAPVARPAAAEDTSEDRPVVAQPPVQTPPEPVKEASKPTPSATPPLPQPRPQQLAQAEPAPTPEPKPEPPKPEPPKPEPKPKPEQKPTPKPVPSKPVPKKTQEKPASRTQGEKSFDPDAIQKLLASKDAPQTAGSTGRVQQAASAGTRTGNSPKLSLSQRDAIGNLMKQQIGKCFSAPPGAADIRVSPVIRVSLNEDGTLAGPPQIISGADDPAARSFAESLMRAIRRCAPYSFPAQYAPYYNDWRDWRIDANPADFMG